MVLLFYMYRDDLSCWHHPCTLCHHRNPLLSFLLLSHDFSLAIVIFLSIPSVFSSSPYESCDWSCSLLRHAALHGAMWLAGTACVGSTDMNRCRKRCISDYLCYFMLYTTSSFHVTVWYFQETLNRWKHIIVGTNVTVFCWTLVDQAILLLTCLSGLLITQINCLHFVSPGLFCSSLLLDNCTPKKVNMPPAFDDFSGT